MMRGFLIGLLALGFAACAQPVELDLPVTRPPTESPVEITPLPTPEPPPSSLIICLGSEPSSLYRYSADYLYGDAAREAEAVLQAIYDGPLDVRHFEYQPVILEKLPSLADDDARYQEVQVAEGELYLNPRTLQPETLDTGDPYLPAGCQSEECIRTFAGGTVGMDQLVVDFRIRSDVRWSDGEPLTATDSVFSFELDRDFDTPTPKTQSDRTSSYEAVDSNTVRWIGIPGYKDSEYFSNFWDPLPEHVLGGFSAEELLTAEEANFNPVGWGPFILQDWRPGQDITLSRNPNYFRSDEDLPGYDVLQFRFLQSSPQGSIEQLLTRECDILDESAIADALGVDVLDPGALAELSALAATGNIEVPRTPGAEMERLDFGIGSVASAGSPNLFNDSRTRTAVAACIDRDRIVSEALSDFSEIPQSYLPPSHPAALDDLEPLSFSPSDANSLLEEVGWMDTDGDPITPRTAQGVEGVLNGTPLSFVFLTTPDAFHRAAAELIREDLTNCGIELTPEYLPHLELFQPWPDGPVFGRAFQTVGWAWPSWVSPLCEMYSSREIPSDDRPLGVNATGFDMPDYDLACSVLLLGRVDSPEYADAVRTTQELFYEALPSIPLYMRPRVLAHSGSVCGLELDPISFSAFWNIESLRACP